MSIPDWPSALYSPPVCASLIPGLSLGSPSYQTKQEHEHNQVLVSDVLSTHRRQGIPYVPNHRWNRFHSKCGLPSAATVPLLFLASVTGKVAPPQVGLYLPPTKVIQHNQ